MEHISEHSIRSVQYFAMAKKWTADLDHFSWESSFLHRLFEDYFLIYNSQLYHQELRKLESRLYDLEKEKDETAKKLELQLKNLLAMVDGKVAEATEELEPPQIEIELKVNGLIHRFREMKKGLYGLVCQSQSAHERFDACQ